MKSVSFVQNFSPAKEINRPQSVELWQMDCLGSAKRMR